MLDKFEHKNKMLTALKKLKLVKHCNYKQPIYNLDRNHINDQYEVLSVWHVFKALFGMYPSQ